MVFPPCFCYKLLLPFTLFLLFCLPSPSLLLPPPSRPHFLLLSFTSPPFLFYHFFILTFPLFLVLIHVLFLTASQFYSFISFILPFSPLSQTDQGIKNLSVDHAAFLSGVDPDYSLKDLFEAIAKKNFVSFS